MCGYHRQDSDWLFTAHITVCVQRGPGMKSSSMNRELGRNQVKPGGRYRSRHQAKHEKGYILTHIPGFQKENL